MIKTNIQGIINKSLGFKPYQVGNQTGWTKRVNRKDGYTNIFKKLPSGTILKETIDSKNIIWAKRGILSNGNEMQSYICDSLGGRAIHITNKIGLGIYAQTRKYYDFQTKKHLPMITINKHKHLYSFIDKIKMHMGIV